MAETVAQIKLKRNGSRFVDLTGRKFGKLTAIRPFCQNRAKQYLWECKCECGGTSVVVGSNLIRGNTKACGCVRITEIADRTRKHGMSKERIFSIWVGMRKRCNNKKSAAYKDYGGRGISISEEWGVFENFYNDMKDGYSHNLSLDRIDPNGNYCKENCRWATAKTQNNNRRSNVYLEINGQKKTLSEWSDISGVRPSLIQYRVNRGWDLNDAINKPSSAYCSIKSISKYLVF